MKKLLCFLMGLFAIISLSACDEGGGEKENIQKVINTVVFINFNSGDIVDGDDIEDYMFALNESPTGMREFFLAESLGNCQVDSISLGAVKVENDEEYYKKYSLITNPNGYKTALFGGKDHIDPFFREQMLIREALLKTDVAGLDADADDDGFADAVTFVINSNFAINNPDTEKILWPHKSEFYPYSQELINGFYIPEGYFDEMDANPQTAFALPEINGARVREYSIVSVGSTVGEICHEFSHVLGLSDYYSYAENAGSIGASYDNIGKYELLGASVGVIPQYSLSYLRSKLGWLEEGKDITVVNSSGEFTLYPVTAGGVQAIKIIPENFAEKGEFFMIEARRKTDGLFDGEINSTGVIVYAVKPENAYISPSGEFGFMDYGNMYGDGNFEVRLILNNGSLNYFTDKNGFDEPGELKFADGSKSGVQIGKITRDADDGFTFAIDVERSGAISEKPAQTKYIADEKVFAIEWSTARQGKTHFMLLDADEYTAAGALLEDLPSGKDVLSGDSRGYKVLYTQVVDNASGFYLPKVNGECYILAVCESGGEIVFSETFHVKVQGEDAVKASFGAFVKVLFKPGNALFIACFVVLGLCVLVGIIIQVIHIRKAKTGK